MKRGKVEFPVTISAPIRLPDLPVTLKEPRQREDATGWWREA